MLKELANRRCCRSYDSTKPVEEEKIKDIIEAGLHAPSAINKQDGIIIAIFFNLSPSRITKSSYCIKGFRRYTFAR